MNGLKGNFQLLLDYADCMKHSFLSLSFTKGQSELGHSAQQSCVTAFFNKEELLVIRECHGIFRKSQSHFPSGNKVADG